MKDTGGDLYCENPSHVCTDTTLSFSVCQPDASAVGHNVVCEWVAACVVVVVVYCGGFLPQTQIT